MDKTSRLIISGCQLSSLCTTSPCNKEQMGLLEESVFQLCEEHVTMPKMWSGKEGDCKSGQGTWEMQLQLDTQICLPMHAACLFCSIHALLVLSRQASQVALEVKNLPAKGRDIRDAGSVPVSGRSPGEGHGNPFQYSCLENCHGQRSLVGYSP